MPMQPAPPRRVRVAIVGSGLTGLVAFYLLSAYAPSSPDAPSISVEIFERASTLGMDSASITVPLPPSESCSAPPQSRPYPASQQEDNLRSRSSKRLKLDTSAQSNAADPPSLLRIDVPMRAFTGGYYPQLFALYHHLGIRIKKTNFTYSFATLPESAASPVSQSSSSLRSPTSAPNKERYLGHPTTEVPGTNTTPAPSPNILYNGANGVRGISLPSSLSHPDVHTSHTIANLLAQVVRFRAYFASLVVLVLGYLQLLVIALWHHHLGHTSDATHPLHTHTLRDLVQQPFPARSPQPLDNTTAWRSRARLFLERVAEAGLRRMVVLDERFAQQTLAPLFSAVMTSSLESVWSCPASAVLDYVALTLGRDHFVVKDGVRTVVAALLAHVDEKRAPSQSASKVWTNAEVRNVQYRDRRAWLKVLHHPLRPDAEDMSRQPSSTSTDRTLCDDSEELAEHGPFDHVIFATQANHSAQFLQQYLASIRGEDSAEAERIERVIGVLSTLKYERSTVINHTDRSLLPKAESDWRDLNLVSPASGPTLNSVQKRWEAVLQGNRRACSDGWTDDESAADEQESSTSNESLCNLGACLLRTKPGVLQAGHTMATHVLSNPGRRGEQGGLVMQTTNPLAMLAPRRARILSRSTFERAVIDVPAHVARQNLFTLSTTPLSTRTPKPGATVLTAGARHLGLGPLQQHLHPNSNVDVKVWVCGSWAFGIPLLEGCVVSARLVVHEIFRLEKAFLPATGYWSP